MSALKRRCLELHVYLFFLANYFLLNYLTLIVINRVSRLKISISLMSLIRVSTLVCLFLFFLSFPRARDQKTSYSYYISTRNPIHDTT